VPTALCAQLRECGISVLSARNSARLALAAQLPGAVLASLTGIEPVTADAWNKRVGHDWTPYIAAKDDQPAGSPRGTAVKTVVPQVDQSSFEPADAVSSFSSGAP
jgi:hypothetical protein